MLDRVLETSPAAHSFSAMRAQCLVGLKRHDEANRLIAEILTKSPGNSDALYVRGLVFCQQGKLETNGMGHFKQVLRGDPGHPASLHAHKTAKEILKLKASGNEAFKKADYASACECYTAALGLDPGNNFGICHILRVNRAVAQKKMGNTDDAITDCTAALEMQGCSQRTSSAAHTPCASAFGVE